VYLEAYDVAGDLALVEGFPWPAGAVGMAILDARGGEVHSERRWPTLCPTTAAARPLSSLARRCVVLHRATAVAASKLPPSARTTIPRFRPTARENDRHCLRMDRRDDGVRLGRQEREQIVRSAIGPSSRRRRARLIRGRGWRVPLQRRPECAAHSGSAPISGSHADHPGSPGRRRKCIFRGRISAPPTCCCRPPASP
jgi:hypothetical protein